MISPTRFLHICLPTFTMPHFFSVQDALYWKKVHNPLAPSSSEQQVDRQSMFPRELSSPLELGDCLFTGPWFAHRAPSIETLATLHGVLGTETKPHAKYLDINDGKRSYHGTSIVNAGEYFTIELHRMFKCVPTWPVWLMAPPCVLFPEWKRKPFEFVSKFESGDPQLCLTLLWNFKDIVMYKNQDAIC